MVAGTTLSRRDLEHVITPSLKEVSKSVRYPQNNHQGRIDAWFPSTPHCAPQHHVMRLNWTRSNAKIGTFAYTVYHI